MRKKLKLAWIVIGISIFLVVVFVWQKSTPGKIENVNPPNTTEGEVESKVSDEKKNDLPNKVAQGVMEQAGGAQVFLTYLEQRELQKQGEVKFFARVIDQHSTPVAGATFDFVLHYYDPNNFRATDRRGEVYPLTQKTNFTLQTSGDGTISVAGRQGTQLDIQSISKDGYLIEIPPYLSFSYGSKLERQLSYWEPAHPRIFKAWKKDGQPVSLMPIKAVIRYRRTVGEERFVRWYVNLLNGQVSEERMLGADLTVTVSVVHPGNGKEDYGHLVVEAINGELGATDHVKPFLAPESLGGNRWECIFDQKYRDTNGGLQNVYLRIRSGKLWFGGEIDARPGPTLTIRGYVNPTGSRNLEPDPEKLITDPETIRRLDEESRRH